MRKLFLGLAAVLTVVIVKAQPPAGEAKKGDTYGEKINADGAISLAALSQKLLKEKTVATKVKGTVLEVCSKKGCWITMELPDKTRMQVKFKEYAFFVPAALSGKTVVLEGLARQKLFTVNELKHIAEDAKKSQKVMDAITQPEKQIKFEATGVLVI